MAIYRVGTGVYAIQLFNYGSGASPNTAGGGFDTYFNSKPYSVNSNPTLYTQVTPFDIELPYSEITSISYVDDVFPYEYPLTEATSEAFVEDLYFYEHPLTVATSESFVIETPTYEHPSSTIQGVAFVEDYQVIDSHSTGVYIETSGIQAGAKNIVRDSNGILHFVYRTTLSNAYYRYSTDRGKTWSSPTQIFTGDYANSNPCIAIDSQNNLHVVMRRGNTPCYQKYTYSTSSWGAVVELADHTPTHLSIVVDANDHLHVVWVGLNSQIYYRKYTTSWQSAEILVSTAYSIIKVSNLNIIIGSDNSVNVIFFRRTYIGVYIERFFHLRYITSWEVVLIRTLSGETIDNISVTADSFGKLHISYYRTYSTNIKRLEYQQGEFILDTFQWSNPIILKDNISDNIVRTGISSEIYTSNLYVFWEETGSKCYLKRFDTNWGGNEILPDGNLISVIDSNFPIIHKNRVSKPERGFAYISVISSGITHYKYSRTLAWEGEITSWVNSLSEVSLPENLTSVITSLSGVPDEPFNSEFVFSSITSSGSVREKISKIPMKFVGRSFSGIDGGITRSLDGTLHCVYTVYVSTTMQYEIHYRNSTDNGETWSEPINVDPQNYGNCRYPKIAVGSDSSIHIVWYDAIASVYKIRYKKFTSSWQPVETIGDGQNPNIAIDSDNNIHIVWVGAYSVLTYRKYTTSWQNSVTFGDVLARDIPYIAIDSNNYIHVVWSAYDPNISIYYQIYYRKYTTSWQSMERLTNYSNRDQSNPYIAIDMNNHIHVVWQGAESPSTISQIRYRKYTDSWQAIEVLTDTASHNSYPYISVDSENTIHVVWHYGSDRTICYRKYTTSWQPTEILITYFTDSGFPCSIVHSLIPFDSFLGLRSSIAKRGFAFICNINDEVCYCKSNDLDWFNIEKLTSIGTSTADVVEYYPYEHLLTTGQVTSGVEELSSVIDVDTVIKSLSSEVDRQDFVEDIFSQVTTTSKSEWIHYHTSDPKYVVTTNNYPQSRILDVARSVEGVLHCIFLNSNSFLSHTKSTDNGSTWSTPVIVFEASSNISNAKIAITSEGQIHLLFKADSNNYHQIYNGISWETPIMLPFVIPSKYSITIDSDDALHLIGDYIYTSERIVLIYRKYTTSWSEPSYLRINDSVSVDVLSVAISVDLSNHLHVITYLTFYDGSYQNKLFYYKYTTDWQDPVIIHTRQYGGTVGATDIAIDNNNYIHVAYAIRLNSSSYMAYYRRYTTSWGAEDSFTWYSSGTLTPIILHISVDATGKAYVLGTHTVSGYSLLRYRVYVNGAYDSEAFLVTMYDEIKSFNSISATYPRVGNISVGIPKTGLGVFTTTPVNNTILYFEVNNLKWELLERLTTTGIITSSLFEVYLYEKLLSTITATSQVSDIMIAGEELTSLANSLSTVSDIKNIYETLTTTIESVSTVSDVIPGVEDLSTTINSIATVTDIKVYTENLQTVISSLSTVTDNVVILELVTTVGTFISSLQELSHVVDVVTSTLNSLSTVEDKAFYLENVISTVNSLSSVILSEPSVNLVILRPKMSNNRLYPKGFIGGGVFSEDVQTTITSVSSVEDTKVYTPEELQTTITGISSVEDTMGAPPEDLQTTITSSSSVEDTQTFLPEDTQTIISSITTVEDMLAYFEHLDTVAQASSSVLDFKEYVEELTSTPMGISSLEDLQFYIDHVNTLITSVSSRTDLKTYTEFLLSNLTSSSAVITVQIFIERCQSLMVSQSAILDSQSYFEAIDTIIISGGSVEDLQNYVLSLQTIITSNISVDDKVYYLDNVLTLIQSGASVADTFLFTENLTSYVTSSSNVIDGEIFKEMIHSTIVSVSAINMAQTFVEVANSVLQSSSDIIDNYKFFETFNSTLLSISSVADRQTFIHSLLTLAKSETSLIEINHYIEVVASSARSRSSLEVVLTPTFVGKFVIGNYATHQSIVKYVKKQSSAMVHQNFVTKTGRRK